ncbi:hypothetical protein E2C01_089085 [Portunus trituberculatus]|uniref:Uncharacterized protein n=1 Tax=Portunus trituberculatus TaxID=210409 RepID=A0A5B7JL98_PORTR|nr:hypothetical protein [Portunus trituberculatus]
MSKVARTAGGEWRSAEVKDFPNRALMTLKIKVIKNLGQSFNKDSLSVMNSESWENLRKHFGESFQRNGRALVSPGESQGRLAPPPAPLKGLNEPCSERPCGRE